MIVPRSQGADGCRIRTGGLQSLVGALFHSFSKDREVEDLSDP